MNASATYQAVRVDLTVYVRANGLANMKNAPILDAFLRAEIEQQANMACIDLSSCGGMDSTFMGLLVGYAKEMEESGGRLVIVNPSPQNLRLLKMLGVTEVVAVAERLRMPEVEFVELVAVADMSPLQRSELIQRAHQHLIAINDANRDKFGAFMTALQSDLAKLRGHG
jgi:anti-anti-sigma factor